MTNRCSLRGVAGAQCLSGATGWPRRALLAAHPGCNLIVSDDGLQHFRLARDLEIVLFDSRGIGNGWLLPAGPLREPVSRARLANLVIANGELPDELRDQFIGTGQFSMALVGARFVRVGGDQAVGPTNCAADEFTPWPVSAIRNGSSRTCAHSAWNLSRMGLPITMPIALGISLSLGPRPS